jgi:hypothetical protein
MLPFTLFMTCFFAAIFLAGAALCAWSDGSTTRCLAYTVLSAITGLTATVALIS